MQFTIATAALFAGLVAAAPQQQAQTTSTVMVTEAVTITSCAESVTQCPARTTYTSYPVVTTVPLVQAAPQPSTTSTVMVTDVITITSCADTVTNCPARTSVTSYAVVTTVPVVAAGTGGLPGVAAASGTGNANGNNGGASNTYHMPSATAYHGPSFTGAANSLNAGAALAGVGAIAALIL